MEDEELETIYDKTRKNRITIYRKNTGTFYYEEEHFSEHPDEMSWIPEKRRVVGIYDSLIKARTEAQANINWLKI